MSYVGGPFLFFPLAPSLTTHPFVLRRGGKIRVVWRLYEAVSILSLFPLGWAGDHPHIWHPQWVDGVPQKQTRVLVSCVNVTMTGGGIQIHSSVLKGPCFVQWKLTIKAGWPYCISGLLASIRISDLDQPKTETYMRKDLTSVDRTSGLEHIQKFGGGHMWMVPRLALLSPNNNL